MYGANYSGFAFHPKAVRMVGSVHFGDFSVLGCGIRGAEPAPVTLPARRQHIAGPVQKIRLPGNFTWNTYLLDTCAPHGNLDGTPCATAPTLSLTEFRPARPTLIPCDPAQHPQCVEQAAATRERCSGSSSACTELPTVSVALIPLVTSCRVPGSHLTQKQKRRVSRETRRPFPAHHATDQAVFFASPRYVSITRGFCASSAAGPSSANSPVSST